MAGAVYAKLEYMHGRKMEGSNSYGAKGPKQGCGTCGSDWQKTCMTLLSRTSTRVDRGEMYLAGTGDGGRKRISIYLFDALFNEGIFNGNGSTNKCLVRPLNPTVVTAEGVG